MKTAQMFFEECVAPSANKLNQTFNVSERFFLSIFGEVVLLCKQGKLTTRIKCEKVS